MTQDAQYDAVTALRIGVQDALNAKDDERVLSLAPGMREGDPEYWPLLWAGACAISAARLGRRDEAWALLDEAVAGGCHQPSLFEPELTELFGVDERFPGFLAALAANVPPPPVELLDWPRPVPALPLQLDRLAPEREAVLLPMLPETRGSAWATAEAYLEWATTRWAHGHNETGAGMDAVGFLEAAGRGERFRCTEYTVVLCQALNAVGIPARGVGLFAANHYTGVGTGHRVTEAWIDDLGAWVVLDGQNGLYWHEEGRPLGLPELMERYRAGEGAPEFTAYSPQWEDKDARTWWGYYGQASVGRTQLVRGGFAPHFEGGRVLEPRWITDDAAVLYPDLSRVDVGTAGVGAVGVVGAVGLRLHGGHPYVEGYEVGGAGTDQSTTGSSVSETSTDQPTTHSIVGAEAVWELPVDQPGEHVVELRARTRYGVVAGGSVVRYRVM